MMKECKTHGKSKHFKTSDGRIRCRKCSSEGVSRWRRRIKIRAIEYKGGCCERCGYNKSVYALVFHHIEPDKKDFSVADGSYRSWSRIIKELDKCILLCQNCHSEEHERMFDELNPDLSLRLNNFKIAQKPNFCLCGKRIQNNNSKCINCYEPKTKIVWPQHTELLLMIKSSSYVKVGKALGVSDTAVRKRVKKIKLKSV